MRGTLALEVLIILGALITLLTLCLYLESRLFQEGKIKMTQAIGRMDRQAQIQVGKISWIGEFSQSTLTVIPPEYDNNGFEKDESRQVQGLDHG